MNVRKIYDISIVLHTFEIDKDAKVTTTFVSKLRTYEAINIGI